jgi:tetratricopeptide (TPR) repeat protein
MLPQMTYAVKHLDELDRIPLGEGIFRPIRHALGVTAFGVNAYTGDEPGDHVIEFHDETSAGAGAHEELYFVATGEAAFEIDGEQVDAPAGTMLLIPPGTRRGARAAAPRTTVLVIGAKPGAGLPVTPFEYWYLANPAYEAGDYARAYEIASAGLAEHPGHPSLNYQLACYQALAGNREKAIEHLRIAYENNRATRDWAAGDDDLASVRDDPALSDGTIKSRDLS